MSKNMYGVLFIYLSLGTVLFSVLFLLMWAIYNRRSCALYLEKIKYWFFFYSISFWKSVERWNRERKGTIAQNLSDRAKENAQEGAEKVKDTYTQIKNTTFKHMPVHIAILKPNDSPFTRSVVEGFRVCLDKELGKPAILKLFEGEGDVRIMAERAKEIVKEPFDAVLSIGYRATKVLKEVADKKKSTLPIVFSGVKDPVATGLIKSLRSSGNNLTGVTGTNFNYEKELSLLHFIKPEAKNILILGQKSDPWALETSKIISGCAEEKGLASTSFFSDDKEDLIVGVKERLESKKYDTVVTLRHGMVIDSVKDLVEISQNHNVTLLSSDNSSVKSGAGIAFGENDQLYGMLAALSMMSILLDRKAPYEISVTLFDVKEKLSLNIAALKKQGIIIPEAMLVLLDCGEIVRDEVHIGY